MAATKTVTARKASLIEITRISRIPPALTPDDMSMCRTVRHIKFGRGFSKRNPKGSVAAPDTVTKAVLTWVLDMLDRGQSVAMASVIEATGSVPGKPGARMAITSDGEKYGTVGGAGLELRVEEGLRKMLNGRRDGSGKSGGRVEEFLLHKDGKRKEVTVLDSLCGGKVTIAMEVLESMPHVLIFGGGHVGRCIAIVCDTMGWSHSVFDVRSEYASEERFPYASELHSTSVEEFLSKEDEITLGRFSDILLLGHDWAIDENFLIQILKKRGISKRPRIGAIGSKSKWSAFSKSATGAGIEKKIVDSVRCPIGLQIGADSPEEIALSVCSEILSLEKGVNPSED